MDEMMFCYQCEQAANCTACTGKAGVCGKSAETADAQDKLTGALIGFATLLLDIGRPIRPPQALLLTEGLFTTITNVDFDPQTVAQLTDKVWKAKQEAFASASPAPAPVSDYDMQKLWQEPDPDRKSLCSFVLFGLRGMAAYSYHARVLGYTDGEIDLFFCTALRAIAQERDKDKLFQLVEDTGRMAYRVMAELDKANTGAFGDPEPVEVSLTIEKGPFIVISGHDLYDAKCLLEQTEGKGINVYTHSEMLPAHGYPELKKRFPHLKGNFGTAWQNQQREFEDIPAPILFTTNCLMPPKERYAARDWTVWARSRFGPEVPIFLMGVSMGAATVLLAAGLNLPDNVCGIVADCGYTSPREITRKCLPEYLPGMPLELTYAVGRLGAILFGHFDPEDADCEAAAAQSKVPILFVHGDADGFVPYDMGKRNYEACRAKGKKFLTVHGAEHAVSYYHDNDAYTKQATEFLQDCLARRGFVWPPETDEPEK